MLIFATYNHETTVHDTHTGGLQGLFTDEPNE